MLMTLLANLPGMAYRCHNDPDWTVEFASEGCRELTGYPSADLVGNHRISLGRLVLEEDRAAIWEAVQAALARRESFEITYRLKRADGVVRWMWERGRGVFRPDGSLEAIEGFITDITARREAETALQESEEKFAKAFRSSPYSLTISDLETGRYVEVNSGFERLSGHARADVIDRTSMELGLWRDPADRARLVAALQRDGSVRGMEIDFVARDGRVVHAINSCEIIELGGRACLLNAIEDVSEQRRAAEERWLLEVQLRQSQKLEALGTLAGGIAHDFNNILTAISVSRELAVLDLDQPEEVRGHLERIAQAGKRASDLVRQILSFSRQQEQARTPLRLGPVVAEALQLLRSTLPATIELDAQLDPAAPVVLADATQVHQIVMNLGTNAAHAMRGRPGRLEVRLEACEVGEELCRRREGLRPGRYAQLSVRDTGHGMDDAVLGRIFEPFFTTKAPGEGTGLGLPVVHGIMKSHDGAVLVESKPGVGTRFDLLFPHHASADEVADVKVPAPTIPAGRGEAVLVVDDELLLAESVGALLRKLGYEPEVVSDPAVALERLSAAPGRFAVLLTDLTMPRLTGLDLSRAARSLQPAPRVVLMSGFHAGWTVAQLRAEGVCELVTKPVDFAVLAQALRRALEA